VNGSIVDEDEKRANSNFSAIQLSNEISLIMK